MVKVYTNVAINYAFVVSAQLFIKDKYIELLMSNGHTHAISFESAWKTEAAYKEAISLMGSKT